MLLSRCSKHKTRTTASKNVGMGGVDDDGAEVVRVRFKGVHLLQSVVVEHPHKHVVLQDKSKTTVTCVLQVTRYHRSHCSS